MEETPQRIWADLEMRESMAGVSIQRFPAQDETGWGGTDRCPDDWM